MLFCKFLLDFQKITGRTFFVFLAPKHETLHLSMFHKILLFPSNLCTHDHCCCVSCNKELLYLVWPFRDMVTCTQSGKKMVTLWIFQDKKKRQERGGKKETKSLYMNESVYFYLKRVYHDYILDSLTMTIWKGYKWTCCPIKMLTMIAFFTIACNLTLFSRDTMFSFSRYTFAILTKSL